MRLVLLLTFLLLAFNAFSMDAEDKEILTLLDGKRYTHLLQSPKGTLGAVNIYRENGIVALAVKKDVLMAVKPKDIMVYNIKRKPTYIQPEMSWDGKYYGVVVVIDPKNKLGNPITKIKSGLRVFQYDSKSGAELPTIALNKTKKYELMFLGKVKIGMLSKVTAAGKKAGAKHKLYTNMPLGALVARIDGKPWKTPVDLKDSSVKDVAVTRISSTEGKLGFIINDKETRNNKGSFYILINEL